MQYTPRPGEQPADHLARILEAYWSEVRRCRLLLEELAIERRATRPHPVVLVESIWQHIGDAAFTSAELLRHARVLPDGVLCNAIRDQVGDVHAARRLGKLLQRIEGEPMAGLAVARLVRERAGQLWQVRKSPPLAP
jgi:hypothetical protein